MIEKLREILGRISGYKQQYDATKAELNKANDTIAEAEPIADKILAIVRSWNEPTDNEAQ